jgi:L-arabinokinase
LKFTKDQFAASIATHGFFPSGRPRWIARAPGRLDFMGGNVDYTGGTVLQGLLKEAVWVAVQPRSDDTVHILNSGAAAFGLKDSCELRTSDLSDADAIRRFCNESDNSRWFAYVLGGLHYLHTHFEWGRSGGADLFIASDLPPNRGVSSSAALEIATLKAAAAAGDISLHGVELATAGQWVENVIVGAACGVMDQAAIVLGRKDSLLPLVCQPCLPLDPLPIPPDLCILGIDSCAPRSTASAAYDAARAAAFIGYKLICLHDDVEVAFDKYAQIPRWTDARWRGYLSELTPPDFRSKYERWLPQSLSGKECLARIGVHVDPFTHINPETEYPVRAAVRYAVEENARVRSVRNILESSASGIADTNLQALGEIFAESHAAYAACGLGSVACDDLVRRMRSAGIAGAKMTGGGGGGVVAAVCRPDQQHRLRTIAQEYSTNLKVDARLFEGSSEGLTLSAVDS